MKLNFFFEKNVNAFIEESLNSVSIHNLLKKICKSIVNTTGMIENLILTSKFVLSLEREKYEYKGVINVQHGARAMQFSYRCVTWVKIKIDHFCKSFMRLTYLKR